MTHRSPDSAAETPPTPSRRGLLLGSGVAAVAGVAVVVGTGALQLAAPGAVAEARKAPEKDDGYRLSQHVLRYYETTRV